MIKPFKFLPFLLLLLSFNLLAQQGGEVLVGLESLTIPSNSVTPKVTSSVIELPLFDDFSRTTLNPSVELWSGKHVFVNSKYAINPKTIGVATFDAINSKGQLHANASLAPFSADTLTSHAVNLDFPTDTTIYLSFYFQPHGLGNQPDLRDSLVLEFYDYQNDKWMGAWAAWVDYSQNKLYQNYKLKDRLVVIDSDTLSRTFFRVHFPILDSRFLNANFQFRFRNFASLSSNTDVPGLRSNSDHWHIDMVYLNKDRSFDDTLFNDITFYKPLESILKNYEAIPWKHFNELAKTVELDNPLGFPIEYRNLGATTWNITRRFEIYNHSDQAVYQFSGGAENIFPFTEVNYTRNYIYDFTSNWNDSAKYTFRTYLITDVNPETSHLRWNDTLSYDQQFKNYYSYDDGTAENGYGLYGEGTQNGRVAVKYSSYESDWLVGVYIYFNRTFNDANLKYFKLAVWDDNNGKPGNIIYEKLGVKPEFTDSLNRFSLYKIDEPLWIDAGTFYVGWIQTTTDMLNVGFDFNNVNNSKIYYNTQGSWETSQYKGSLMVRPVFGELTEPPTLDKPLDNTMSFRVYPNPANTSFSIDLPAVVEISSVKIFNMAGQQVLTTQYLNQPIDISRLDRGIYLIQLVSKSNLIGTQKLIVIR